jgi:uncharacterized membrane protein YfcA
MTWQFSLAGLLVGVLVGLTGMGGGSLIVQPSNAPFILQTRDKLIATTMGAVFGFVVGLTSVGSGTFFGLVMVIVFPLTIPKIVGTDIFHAAALCAYGVNAPLARPRPATARGFD